MFEKSPTSNHMCTHTYFMAHTYIDLDFEYFLSVVVVIAEHIANLTSQMISSHSIVGGSFRLVVLASTARLEVGMYDGKSLCHAADTRLSLREAPVSHFQAFQPRYAGEIIDNSTDIRPGGPGIMIS